MRVINYTFLFINKCKKINKYSISKTEKMSIKIKDLKRDSIMNLYRNFKSLDEIQTVMHMAFPDMGFITTNVKNSINF